MSVSVVLARERIQLNEQILAIVLLSLYIYYL